MPYETSAGLNEVKGVRHGFFGRQGGISSGVYASLNVSEAGADLPSNAVENRRAAANALGFTVRDLATLTQTHSNHVITISEPPVHGSRPEADALVTNLPGLLLGILTADCTPILLADSEAGIIAASHAGWKGAVDGIIGNTVVAMTELGADPQRIVVAIGPTIWADNYEVGEDFADSLLARHPDAAAFFTRPAGGRPHFDLPGFVERQLRQAGILMIERAGSCTYASPERYFSHRYATHQGTTTGRQISLIGILPA